MVFAKLNKKPVKKEKRRKSWTTHFDVKIMDAIHWQIFYDSQITKKKTNVKLVIEIKSVKIRKVAQKTRY